MKQMNPCAGDIIITSFAGIDVWDDTLLRVLHEFDAGVAMLVLDGPPYFSKEQLDSDSTLASIDVKRYVKVLAPNGIVGYVHRDNCSDLNDLDVKNSKGIVE